MFCVLCFSVLAGFRVNSRMFVLQKSTSFSNRYLPVSLCIHLHAHVSVVYLSPVAIADLAHWRRPVVGFTAILFY